MTWFCAHVIEAIELLEGPQTTYPVYENVFLLEASSPAEAEKIAYLIGQNEAVDDGLTLNDMPAKRVFKGVRKLIKISNPTDSDLDQWEDPPIHGTEVTYSYFELVSQEAINNLVTGKSVTVDYVE